MYAHECRYQKKPEDPSGTGITGGCEVPVVGAKNRTWVFWKSSVCSQPLNHLSPFPKYFLNECCSMEFLFLGSFSRT